MINKQSIWFVTLFSFIIILSIYYLTINNTDLKEFLNNNISNSSTPVWSELEPSSLLVSMRLEDDELVLKEIQDLESILIDNTKTSNEKNNAYNSLLAIQDKKKEEEKIEKKIKEIYNIDTFVKINSNNITITSTETKHDMALANKIIRTTQELYQDNKYITVKFKNE